MQEINSEEINLNVINNNNDLSSPKISAKNLFDITQSRVFTEEH